MVIRQYNSSSLTTSQPLEKGIDPLEGVMDDSCSFFRIIRLFEVGDELWSD